MSTVSNLIKNLKRVIFGKHPTIEEEVEKIFDKNTKSLKLGEKIPDSIVNRIVEEIIKIIIESQYPTKMALAEAIIPVCNNEKFPDNVTVRLLSSIIKSQHLSTEIALKALNNKETIVTDSVNIEIIKICKERIEKRFEIILWNSINESDR